MASSLQADSISTTSAIPSDLAERSARGGLNLKFIVGGLLLIGVIVALIVQATLSTGAYYLTVSEVTQSGGAMVGQRVRVSGAVVVGSEEWDAQAVTLRFRITDGTGAELPIVFYGPRPDNFVRAAEAIVEGELLGDGSFEANTLLLKCPSRYEEEPEEIFVEATH